MSKCFSKKKPLPILVSLLGLFFLSKYQIRFFILIQPGRSSHCIKSSLRDIYTCKRFTEGFVRIHFSVTCVIDPSDLNYTARSRDIKSRYLDFSHHPSHEVLLSFARTMGDKSHWCLRHLELVDLRTLSADGSFDSYVRITYIQIFGTI
ncbi:hypothetical protein K439DRAFT_877143 [Ramaria rubella]|nr:hypothetical protein K439DRAFT_877143 [Ramaria rubella]